ncbi:MAG: MarR family transcriptional regulator [Planctomycetota bacterium]|nr:MarR family transcriptional regulator [Planctomycetota bacterium]
MLEYDYEDSVGYWLMSANHAIRRALEAELAHERITIRQWEVLTWLSLEGDLTQADLAERMRLEAPTLTGILCRMERDGWLERRSCDDDRRCKRIRVTEEGEAVWQRIAACGRRVRQRATEGLTAEELQVFKSICNRLRANLGTDADCIAHSHG